jgi:hypothetical protein
MPEEVMVDTRKPAINIELAPTLSRCIETVAKREYWRSVDDYLKAKTVDKGLEERIELLKSFLETADFTALRSQSEQYIIEGKKVTFTVFVKDGKPCHRMSIE